MRRRRRPRSGLDNSPCSPQPRAAAKAGNTLPLPIKPIPSRSPALDRTSCGASAPRISVFTPVGCCFRFCVSTFSAGQTRTGSLSVFWVTWFLMWRVFMSSREARRVLVGLLTRTGCLHSIICTCCPQCFVFHTAMGELSSVITNRGCYRRQGYASTSKGEAHN